MAGQGFQYPARLPAAAAAEFNDHPVRGEPLRNGAGVPPQILSSALVSPYSGSLVITSNRAEPTSS